MNFVKPAFFVCILALLTETASAASLLTQVNLRYVASSNPSFNFVPAKNSASLQNKNSVFSFLPGSRKCSYNNILIWLNARAIRKTKQWSIARGDEIKTVNSLFQQHTVLKGKQIKTVVLDPGHGGDDSGAIGHRRVYEKKVVLDIARRVKRKLKSSSIRVLLTRDWDIYLELSQRTKFANRQKADLFVSIHANAATSRIASGIETYVMTVPGFPSTSSKLPNTKTYPGNKNDEANMILAYCIQKSMLAQTGAIDRGIKHARFAVLRETHCPAVLTECGFVSNATEETKMIKAEYRDSIAEGIAQGIRLYILKTDTANR